MFAAERIYGDKSLEEWIANIENTWRDIPEYKVDSDRFRHLAVICDGNRRSAKQKGLEPYFGHRLGLEVILGTMQACKKWGVRNLTFWTWSTENWKRDRAQTNFVMDLAATYLQDDQIVSKVIENEVRFRQIGRSDRIPQAVREAIIRLEEKTVGFTEWSVNLALDYGGLDELARASARMIEAGVVPEDITENPEILLNYLDTAGQPMPDLVIRTGTETGEVPHTSGFMPIQTAYSGWQFVPDLFPDLTPTKLVNCMRDFLEYEMRKGK